MVRTHLSLGLLALVLGLVACDDKGGSGTEGGGEDGGGTEGGGEEGGGEEGGGEGGGTEGGGEEGGGTDVEDCGNDLDDDADGDVDCDDEDCADDAACSGTGGEDCSDGADNDSDGDADCADSDCAGEDACSCLVGDLGGAVGDEVAAGNLDGMVDHTMSRCGGDGGEDVGWLWTVPEDGCYIIDTFGSDLDTVLYYLPDDCDGRPVDCNDDASGLDSMVSTDELEAGETYVIVVDDLSGDWGDWDTGGGWGEDEDGTSTGGGSTGSSGGSSGGSAGRARGDGDYVLNIAKMDETVDEDLGEAVGPEVSVGSTAGADGAIPVSCADIGDGLVFSWTAPEDGVYLVDTFGSDFDTVLAIRDGLCGGEELECNDDSYGDWDDEPGWETGGIIVDPGDPDRDSGPWDGRDTDWETGWETGWWSWETGGWGWETGWWGWETGKWDDGGTTSEVYVSASAGHTYTIILAGFGGATGDYQLNIVAWDGRPGGGGGGTDTGWSSGGGGDADVEPPPPAKRP